MTNPLKSISDTLTDETDVFVNGVDVCVTKGPQVDGNVVTLRVHGDEEVLLGFGDAQDYEEFVDRVTEGSSRTFREDTEAGGDHE